MSVIFQNPAGEDDDGEVYRRELALADLAEPLGFDSVWGVEHHFTGYTMCPDVLQFLTWVAARTSRVQVGSMVVVLPWHDPVRVAEEVAMLDQLSGGRLLLGLGRGLGRVEFEGLRVPMGESRERFVEAARIVLDGLERGYVEHDGQFWQQPRRDIRPRPTASFRGRTYAAAVSPESMQIMAELGVGVLVIPQKPWDDIKVDIDRYRTVYREVQGTDAPPALVAGWVFCDPDAGRARELGVEHLGRYYDSVVDHYELYGTQFAETKGYEYYRDQSARLQQLHGDGVDPARAWFPEMQFYGTPDQVVDKVVHACEVANADGFIMVPSYGGMAPGEAERNLRLFAETVRPRLQEMGSVLQPA